MKNEMSWSGTAIKNYVFPTGDEKEVFINNFWKDCRDKDGNDFSSLQHLRRVIEQLEPVNIFKIKNVLFMDIEYIVCETNKRNMFSTIVERLMAKDWTESEFYYFNSKTLKHCKIFNIDNDSQRYLQIINKCVIDIPKIEKQNICASPEFFFKFNEAENIDENKKVLNFLCELFSLIAISNSTTYNDELKTFNFEIWGIDGHKSVKIVNWGVWDSLKSDDFYKTYKWIFDDIKTENIRKKIVRNSLCQHTEFNISEKSILEFEQALNIIVNDATKEYSRLQELMKNELISSYKNIVDIRQQFMKSLLGIITAMGLGFYGLVFKEANFVLVQKNNLLALLLAFFLVAELYTLLNVILSNYRNNKFNEKIKLIYTDKMGITNQTYEDIMQQATSKMVAEYILIGFIIALTLIGILLFLCVFPDKP